MSGQLGKVSALRTFRVLRALKTVAVVPGQISHTVVCFFCSAVTIHCTAARFQWHPRSSWYIKYV